MGVVMTARVVDFKTMQQIREMEKHIYYLKVRVKEFLEVQRVHGPSDDILMELIRDICEKDAKEIGQFEQKVQKLKEKMAK
jgi:hypothetical protein